MAFFISSLVFFSSAGISTSLVLPSNAATAPKGPIAQLRPVNGSGILRIPITRQTEAALSKRQYDPNTIYNHNALSYLIEIYIGTPPQPVVVTVDTGSWPLWVDPICANAFQPAQCNAFPNYDPYSSSTALDAGYTFDFTYGTGFASGEYLLDTITVGSGTIPQVQFGWPTASNFDNVGIVGVGLGYSWNLNYYGVIDQLYVNGITASRAFSLDLASVDAAARAMIFGGIDTMKYIGSLYKSPMIPAANSPDGSARYWFDLTYVGITYPGDTTSTPITSPGNYVQAMVPDSGATLSYLPTNLFNALIAHFPSAVQQSNGDWTVDCALRSQSATIDFGFGTKIIHVNLHEWIWQAGSTTCVFGGQPSDDSFILGDTFMRSAYFVYDQDNFNIHIVSVGKEKEWYSCLICSYNTMGTPS